MDLPTFRFLIAIIGASVTMWCIFTFSYCYSTILTYRVIGFKEFMFLNGLSAGLLSYCSIKDLLFKNFLWIHFFTMVQAIGAACVYSVSQGFPKVSGTEALECLVFWKLIYTQLLFSAFHILLMFAFFITFKKEINMYLKQDPVPDYNEVANMERLPTYAEAVQKAYVAVPVDCEKNGEFGNQQIMDVDSAAVNQPQNGQNSFAQIFGAVFNTRFMN